MSESQLKAEGGRRAKLAQAHALLASTGRTYHPPLAVDAWATHEERGRERAEAEGRSAAPPSNNVEKIDMAQEARQEAAGEGRADSGVGHPSGAETNQRPATEDGDGIPAFLRRPRKDEATKEEKMKRVREAVGSDRKIKNPPDGKIPEAKKNDQTKKAKLVSMATTGWHTEAELCRRLGGWKACLTTLRRACAEAGLAVERRNRETDGKSEYRAVTAERAATAKKTRKAAA